MLLLTLLQFIKQSLKLNWIKVVFVEKDMSQTQLAQLLGKSFSSVNAYCINRTQLLLDVLKQIADIPPKEYEDDFNRKASLLLDYIDILSQESHHLRTLLTFLTLLTLLTSKLS